MGRDWDHAVLGAWLGGGLRGQGQVGLDHILELVLGLLHGLVDDDPVHRTAEIEVDLLEDGGGVDALALVAVLAVLHFLFQIAGGEGHLNNSVLLF